MSIPKKGNAKECSNHCTIVLISHASKVMLKIPQDRLQGRGTLKAAEQEIKMPTSAESQKNPGKSRKTSTYASLTKLKPLCRLQQTVENS